MTTCSTPTPPNAPNWDLIEAEYRAGIKPLRAIAEGHGITHGAINKRAKRDGWTRDLAARIQAKAEAMVSKALVSSEVSKERLATERLVVDANANAVFEVRMAHRTAIERSRTLFESLIGELEGLCTPQGQSLVDELAQAITSRDDAEIDQQEAAKRLGRIREALQRVMSRKRAANPS